MSETHQVLSTREQLLTLRKRALARSSEKPSVTKRARTEQLWGQITIGLDTQLTYAKGVNSELISRSNELYRSGEHRSFTTARKVEHSLMSSFSRILGYRVEILEDVRRGLWFEQQFLGHYAYDRITAGALKSYLGRETIPESATAEATAKFTESLEEFDEGPFSLKNVTIDLRGLDRNADNRSTIVCRIIAPLFIDDPSGFIGSDKTPNMDHRAFWGLTRAPIFNRTTGLPYALVDR